MINLLDLYGLDENIGFHVILSNLFWWMSVVLMIIAYRYRSFWNVGYTPWSFLFFGFLFFAIRELGHLITNPVLISLRYIFGIWSAIFMTSAFIFFFIVIYMRKKPSLISTYLPVALASMFPILMFYLYFLETNTELIKNIMSLLESLIWMIGSSITIYITFKMGTCVSGGFVNVFMLFQFSAYTAFMWKFLGILEMLGWPVPYSIREIVETLFGLFAIISVYLLTKMLRKLSKDMYGNKS
jgi:hypothetical protein